MPTVRALLSNSEQKGIPPTANDVREVAEQWEARSSPQPGCTLSHLEENRNGVLGKAQPSWPSAASSMPILNLLDEK